MNYYERHIGDYAKNAGHLSMLEHGAYTLLLDRYYSTEKGIPVDQVYKVTHAHSKQERAAVDAVLNEFFILSDGVWIKNRCQEEIAAAHARIFAAQENGKKGGRPRKEKTQEKPSGFNAETQSVSSGLDLGSKNKTQQKALQSPISNLQSEDSRRGEDPPPVGTIKTQIYRLALQLEIAAGTITNELKAHSETQVWQALGSTLAAKPAEALPYFRACLKDRGANGAEQRRAIP